MTSLILTPIFPAPVDRLQRAGTAVLARGAKQARGALFGSEYAARSGATALPGGYSARRPGASGASSRGGG